MYSVTIVPECVTDINQSLMILRNYFKSMQFFKTKILGNFQHAV